MKQLSLDVSCLLILIKCVPLCTKIYRRILCIKKEEKQSVDAVAGGVQPCAPGTRVLPLGPRRMETDQVYIPDWLRGNRQCAASVDFQSSEDAR